MSYLQRTDGIDTFSKAVISLWFRIPAATLAAAAANYLANDPDDDHWKLLGIVPLITFGESQSVLFYQKEDDDADGLFTAIGPVASNTTSPSVIGVKCDGDNCYLTARFQYASGGPAFTTGVILEEFHEQVEHDHFLIGGYQRGSQISGRGPTGQFLTVTPDLWHHVLISLDFSGGCNVTQAPSTDPVFNTVCPFFWAYDDVNYNGQYLYPNSPQCFGGGGNANGIVSNYTIGGGSFAAGNIPSSPLGIPAKSGDVSFVYNVEMAEFQLFTGVTLDTSDSTNRRAFVTAGGIPADPALASTLLGKDPDILLHGTRKWKAGTNSGTAGNFSTAGSISLFTPGPDLTP